RDPAYARLPDGGARHRRDQNQRRQHHYRESPLHRSSSPTSASERRRSRKPTDRVGALEFRHRIGAGPRYFGKAPVEEDSAPRAGAELLDTFGIGREGAHADGVVASSVTVGAAGRDHAETLRHRPIALPLLGSV